MKTLERQLRHSSAERWNDKNLDVIKTADWIIDMRPEGGDGGGLLLAEGSPETVTGLERSYSGRYLRRFFGK